MSWKPVVQYEGSTWQTWVNVDSFCQINVSPDRGDDWVVTGYTVAGHYSRLAVGTRQHCEQFLALSRPVLACVESACGGGF